MSEIKRHWEEVYGRNAPEDVSWYQVEPEPSLSLILRCGLPLEAPILEVGGGASRLVDALLDHGFSRLSVLDVSGAALAIVRRRLGDRASQVRWIESDVFDAPLEPGSLTLWHDRAVFHFLVEPESRRAYFQLLSESLMKGGFAVLGAFGPEGPESCSGLQVQRVSEASLVGEMGPGFELVESLIHEHRTPFDTVQQFLFARFMKL
ncbi:MAG: class I SAM-dependent methyltransferase [Armatimonadetes bacterium]|nr:class I SAM-dependent methyltransferase [Armatimonadota bacterium]